MIKWLPPLLSPIVTPQPLHYHNKPSGTIHKSLRNNTTSGNCFCGFVRSSNSGISPIRRILTKQTSIATFSTRAREYTGLETNYSRLMYPSISSPGSDLETLLVEMEGDSANDAASQPAAVVVVTGALRASSTAAATAVLSVAVA